MAKKNKKEKAFKLPGYKLSEDELKQLLTGKKQEAMTMLLIKIVSNISIACADVEENGGLHDFEFGFGDFSFSYYSTSDHR